LEKTPSDEELRNKTVVEICELVEKQARIIHNQQELIELLIGKEEYENMMKEEGKRI